MPIGSEQQIEQLNLFAPVKLQEGNPQKENQLVSCGINMNVKQAC